MARSANETPTYYQRESLIPPIDIGEEGPGADSPWRIETVQHLRHWVQEDAETVLAIIRDMKSDYEEVVVEHNKLVLSLENSQIKINRQAGMIEYQKEELEEARRMAAAATAPAGSNAPPPFPPPHDLQGSPARCNQSEESLWKSMKLPDPPVFIDGKEPSIDHWLTKMRSKLAANEDHKPTELFKKAYVENRVGGEAMGHLEPRLRKNAIKPFLTAEEMFDHLERIYGDPNRKQTAMNLFRSLRQGQKDFNTFWAEFQRLAAELDHNESTLIGELKHKLNLDMRRQLATGDHEPTDLYAFAQRCQRMYQALKDVDRSKARMERFAEGKKPTSVVVPANTPTATTESKTYVAPNARTESRAPSSPSTLSSWTVGSYLSESERERLSREGKCFNCKEVGHPSRDCPKKKSKMTAIINELDVEPK